MKTLNKIIKSNPIAFETTIKAILLDCIQTAGVKNMSDDDRINFISKSIELVKEDYSFITGEELRFAIKQGVLGRYGEYYGLSAVSVDSWLRKYLVSPDRDRYINTHTSTIDTSHLLSDITSITTEEKNKIIERGINKDYIYFLNNGKLRPIINKIISDKVNTHRREYLLNTGRLSSKETILDMFIRFQKKGLTKIY